MMRHQRFNFFTFLRKMKFAVVFLQFHQKIEGFFIEAGALDGERLSNTLYMERFLNWTGILIEADPKSYALLLEKNRKAYSLPICLSLKPYPTQVCIQQICLFFKFPFNSFRTHQLLHDKVGWKYQFIFIRFVFKG